MHKGGIIIFVYKKNDVYSSHCYLIQYNDDYFRIVLNKFQRAKGFEPLKHNSTELEIENFMAPSDIKNNSIESERTSLSRTKRNIKELALCNSFQYFATITINSSVCDRYNLIECQKKLKFFLRKIKRKNKDFKYLFITEKHKDNAFHFHGLVKNIPLYINDNGYYSCSILDNLGFNSFSKIINYNKCCNYICKYISKDCIRNEHNQIYISSRGLSKADKYEIPLVDLDWSFENDFVKIKDFSFVDSSCSINDFFQILGLYNPTNLKKI